MIINLVVAGVSGVALPILLEKMKVDPAVASGVFVTTITDVIRISRILGLGIDFFTLMAKERRVFVTGSTGCIGTHAVDLMIEEGAESSVSIVPLPLIV